MRYRIIRTEQLTKSFGRTAAVNGLTFEVEPGEIYGLLGASGAGKTTTLQMLLDFLRPTAGRALVFNLDSHKNSVEIRRQTGYLPANFDLDSTLTVEETLRWLARLRRGVDWSLTQALADDFRLPMDQKIRNLNAADRRKVGLVQAFMHRPDLIILDEPLRGLDLDAQQTFYRLASEARADGRSVFFATSAVNEVERICDRVAILQCGELIAVERGVHLRARALRRVEMRFAGPVPRDAFLGVPNLQDLRMMENTVCCVLRGDPDLLLKTASQYRVTDFVSQTLGVEDMFASAGAVVRV